VAADPPATVRAELAAWARSAAAVSRPMRLLEPELLHLTLCFLGSLPVEEIEAVGTAVETCARPVGELSVGAPLWLPPRRPRALAVEIHDDAGDLAVLHEAVTDAVADASGWEPERRRYRPHITVARMREEAAADRRSSSDLGLLPPTPALSFAPEALVLYRSWLAPAGASYEAVATHVLAA